MVVIMNDEEYYKMIENLKNSRYVLIGSSEEDIVQESRSALINAKDLILQISKIPDQLITEDKIKEITKLLNNMVSLELVTEINVLIQ